MNQQTFLRQPLYFCGEKRSQTTFFRRKKRSQTALFR